MDKALLATPPSLYDQCQASGGLGGMDARGTNAKSVKDLRLKADQKVTIRSKQGVAMVSGSARGDMSGPARKGDEKPITWTNLRRKCFDMGVKIERDGDTAILTYGETTERITIGG